MIVFAKRIMTRAKGLALSLNRNRPRFACPCCGYSGVFLDVIVETGRRDHAKCPRCNSLERHRLQSLVLDRILSELPTSRMRMLHFAPEPFFTKRFRRLFGSYETADIDRGWVDHQVDMQALPMRDGQFDIVYASHVLEHIPDDRRALRELHRILSPGGMAILPVPIVTEVTVEYDAPNPNESMHMRAPGLDYFDRYRDVFKRVDLHAASAFGKSYRCMPVESKAGSSRELEDYVPVCIR